MTKRETYYLMNQRAWMPGIVTQEVWAEVPGVAAVLERQKELTTAQEFANLVQELLCIARNAALETDTAIIKMLNSK